MNLWFSHPWVLSMLIFSIVPLVLRLHRPVRYPCTALLPGDAVSDLIDSGLRLMAAILVSALVTGLAGPYRNGETIEKIGTGAQIVLLLDRSASMNQNFSGRYMGGRSHESKGQYAQKLLAEFVNRRKNDLFSIVSFSTSPMYTLPFTQNQDAILAALRAAAMKGRGITNIASGLAMALSFFDDRDQSGSRVILLVSDGATRIDEDTRHSLAQWFRENRVTLYWIYLRNPNSARLSERPENPNEKTTPEYFLHQYFSSINIPYRSYEAENPEAIRQAISDIGKLENKPVVYSERIPKTDLSPACYALATLLLSVLIITKTMEVDPWKK